MKEQVFLTTSRLLLRSLTKSDSSKFQQFEEQNKEHFAKWASTVGNISYDDQFKEYEKEYEAGKSIRFVFFIKNDIEADIIGICNFTQIFRSAFHACYLGYKIDKSYEGKGFMSEALKIAIQYMFEKENLHRIMANYIPTNERSALLLGHLGFNMEGYAKDYLFINGQWEDHILTSLTNQQWKP
ncbi:MAG: GNAT family N-acetyltransferase [Chlamydiales bacterium]|nr:GNAT family N-acetyltransferase [Chlamydiales bacterium]